MPFLSAALGTLAERPYVFAFLLAFLTLAGRELGSRRTALFLALGFSLAFGSEYASTRIGLPFGFYQYTGETRGRELFLSNVPFFDPLSFPFLAYASWCLARKALGRERGKTVILLAGFAMMWLDVVIDPLAVRGARWFLGNLFFYPAGGVYFGVPLGNFAGWWLVGSATVGAFLTLAPPLPLGNPLPGLWLYYGILAFNLALTAWIGEPVLFAAGLVLHALLGLALVAFRRVERAELAPS
jgi:uncharacterized membrane protein